jgi:hypothetical protein
MDYQKNLRIDMNPELVATWTLVKSFSTTVEILFEAEFPDRDVSEQIDDWLYGNSYNLRDDAKLTTGLTLKIDANGAFSEENIGNPQISWFDREGVLDDKVVTFSGIIKTEDRIGYLNLEQSEAKTISNTVPMARVRYDDGDTIICDKVEVIDKSLVRTISVVTDELYLDRTMLIYEKSDR